jgi:hypothetical protein
MQKRLFCGHILASGIVFLMFFSFIPVWAETSCKPVVYVWDFITRDGEKNELTTNLTEEFEEPLVKCGCFIVLERRNYARLIAHIDNEKAIAQIESISTTTLDSLIFYHANMVVFGEVYYDINNGEIKITVTFEKFDGTKNMLSTRLGMEPATHAKNREKAMKKLVKEICPNPKRENKWGLGSSIISQSIAAIILIARANHFGDKAEQARIKIPPVLSEERVEAFGEYKQFETRECWYYVAAGNSTIGSLPFWFDLLNIKPRIGKWSVASLFFISSTTFFTYGMISGEKANDTYHELETKYSDLSEDRVKYWGEYRKYSEREHDLYINAVIDLIKAGEILLWYNRDDEGSKELHLYLDSQKMTKLSLNFDNGNWISTPQIGIVLQKYF